MRQKDKKQDSSASLSIYSDYSDDSGYKRKQCKKKIHREKDSIKSCARLMAKLLTTEYKSKIVKFKLDEEPLQRRIYFITFVESLEMLFYQYEETCEVLLYYPKMGGEDIKSFAKNSIRNILRSNIDVHSRTLITGLPADGIKCIEKLQ